MNYKIIKVFFYTLELLVLFAAVAASVLAAEITGPESVQIGQLATYESNVEGDWLVVPAKGVGIAKDSGKKALFLAATREGDLTVIFFGVEDGTPVITQKAVTVGTPEPDPEPGPSPAPTPILNLTDAEREAASFAFQTVLDGIRNGTIRTPQGARASFKKVLVEKVGTCAEGSCQLSNELTAALEMLEKNMDLTTLEGMRKGFEKALEDWK